MKKLLFAAAALVFVALPLSLWSPAQATKTKAPTKVLAATVTTNATTSVTTGIAFTWNYTANVPACPANGTPLNCQNGFTLTDTSTNTIIATPATIGPAALSYQYTPAGGLYFGTHSFSIVANGFDGNGAALVSAASTTSVTNSVAALNGPTGLVGVAH